MTKSLGLGASLVLMASLGITSTGCIASTDGSDEQTQGAANSATPESVGDTENAVSSSVCGSGYKLVGNIPLRINEGNLPLPKEPVGELEVFYNAAKGRNCLVLQSLGRYYGMKKRMFVRVCTRDMDAYPNDCLSAENYDSGAYYYYAGPVYITAPHQCIYYASGIYEPNSTRTYVAFGKGFCG